MRTLKFAAIIVCWLVAVLVTPTSSRAGTLCFAESLVVAPMDSPEAATVVDLDGDNDLDVVVAAYLRIWVFLQNSDGSFATPVFYGGVQPVWVCQANVDGDSSIDMAVSNLYGGVSVFKNHGDGTFAPHIEYPVGDRAFSVTAGDFDGDGRVDLGSISSDGDSVSILFNDGDSNFAAAVGYPVQTEPHSIVSEDLNGDTRPDLAIANNGSNSISVLLNNGDGTFSPASSYSAGNAPYELIAADLNGDGHSDLAATNALSNNLSVLINKGDGTFYPRVNYSTGYWPNGLFAADIDGDSDVDLAACIIGAGPRELSLLRNRGDGTFASPVRMTLGSSPNSVYGADIDADGDIDFVLPASTGLIIMYNCTIPCSCPFQSDLDESGALDALDLNALIDALFFGGPDPQDALCPTSRSDCNNDGAPDALDLNYLIEHLFFGGQPPIDPCAP